MKQQTDLLCDRIWAFDLRLVSCTEATANSLVLPQRVAHRLWGRASLAALQVHRETWARLSVALCRRSSALLVGSLLAASAPLRAQ